MGKFVCCDQNYCLVVEICWLEWHWDRIMKPFRFRTNLKFWRWFLVQFWNFIASYISKPIWIDIWKLKFSIMWRNQHELPCDMAKNQSTSVSEIEHCAWWCRFMWIRPCKTHEIICLWTFTTTLSNPFVIQMVNTSKKRGRRHVFPMSVHQYKRWSLTFACRTTTNVKGIMVGK